MAISLERPAWKLEQSARRRQQSAESGATGTLLMQALSRYTFPPGFLEAVRKLGRKWQLRPYTPEQAELLVREYLRFVYLSSLEVVTPSQRVDDVWHLHLTYSRDYWERFMPLLPRPLHHDPSPQGAADPLMKFQYERTLDRYRAEFGERPHPGIWPDHRLRRVRGAPHWWGKAALLLPLAVVGLFLWWGLSQVAAAQEVVFWPWIFALGVAAYLAHLIQRYSVARSKEDRTELVEQGVLTIDVVYDWELDGFLDSDGSSSDGSDSDSSGDGGSDGGGGCGGGGCGS
ncbi:glycine-rich domain-containing protein [Deinococcus lacus]|uniref:Glycine-rich domain-containing protein n=1 Tax=Deinococcus lacus TaxID=392561 RepID=A0ABW1YFQ9_9DEIO